MVVYDAKQRKGNALAVLVVPEWLGASRLSLKGGKEK
jgi:hypothetical protein